MGTITEDTLISKQSLENIGENITLSPKSKEIFLNKTEHHWQDLTVNGLIKKGGSL